MFSIQSVGQTALRNWNQHNKSMSQALERLTTGKRINHAADDACGLAISEKMKSQLSMLDEEISCTSQTLASVNTTDGTMSNITNILQRMKKLATQASNGTLSATDRQALNATYQQLRSEVDREGHSVQDGSTTSLFQTNDLKSAMDGATTYAGNNLNQFLDAVNSYVTENQDKFASVTDLHQAVADYAAQNAQQLLNVPLGNAAVSLDSAATASSANSSAAPSYTLYISKSNVVVKTSGFSTDSLQVGDTDLLTVDDATKAMDVLDKAIDRASVYRGNYGASESSLQYTLDYLQDAEQNLNDSLSAILDTDVASELMRYAQQHILMQTSTFVMAQCRLQASNVLKLIQ